MIIVSLLILRMMIPLASGCLQTMPGTTPSPTGTTTTTTTTTTTVAPTDCCPEVPLILTNSAFPDGTATFAYNSNTCRTTATATCSSTDTSLDLYAAIVGNEVNYLEYAQNTAQSQFTCVGGSWVTDNQNELMAGWQVNNTDIFLDFGLQSITVQLRCASSLCVTDPGIELFAGIVGNAIEFLDFAASTVSVQFSCASGAWTYTAQGSTLMLNTVECILTTTPTNNG